MAGADHGAVSDDGKKQEGDEEEEQHEERRRERLDSSHDPFFPPVVSLPEVDVPSGEDDEDVIFKMRAKLYRFAGDSDPAEWKERGTGDAKLLRHRHQGQVRLLMRREKTLKVCANHFIRPWMILKPMKGSDKAFMWQVHADFADEAMKSEVFAIRFSTAENASKFKAAFDDAVVQVTEVEAGIIECNEDSEDKKEPEEGDGVTDAIEKLNIAKA